MKYIKVVFLDYSELEGLLSKINDPSVMPLDDNGETCEGNVDNVYVIPLSFFNNYKDFICENVEWGWGRMYESYEEMVNNEGNDVHIREVWSGWESRYCYVVLHNSDEFE